MERFFDTVKENFSKNIKEDALAILYHLVLILAILVVLYLLLIIGLWFKRWYIRGKIKRNEPDFRQSMEFLKSNKRPLNIFERVTLDLTGLPFGVAEVIGIIVIPPAAIAFLYFTGLLAKMHIWMENIMEAHIWIAWVSVVALLIAFVYALYNLIRYSRIAMFIVTTIWLVIGGIPMMIYIVDRFRGE